MPGIAIRPHDLDWQLVVATQGQTGELSVLYAPGLMVIVSLLANIVARCVGRGRSDHEQLTQARRDLERMTSGDLPEEVTLIKPEAAIARAMGQAMLRFLMADACVAAWFSEPGPRTTHENDDVGTVLPSRWLRDVKFMKMIATFVTRMGRLDAFSSGKTEGNAGVTLLLWVLARWEFSKASPPGVISEEIAEDLWSTRALDAWRDACTDESGTDHSYWKWVLSVTKAS